MIMVANRIPVAESFGDQFEERFRKRAGLVDTMPGFIRWELLRPIKGDSYVVVTYWETQQDFENWTNSTEFKEGHAQRGADAAPREMFRGHPVLEIHEVIMESERKAD